MLKKAKEERQVLSGYFVNLNKFRMFAVQESVKPA